MRVISESAVMTVPNHQSRLEVATANRAAAAWSTLDTGRAVVDQVFDRFRRQQYREEQHRDPRDPQRAPAAQTCRAAAKRADIQMSDQIITACANSAGSVSPSPNSERPAETIAAEQRLVEEA